MLAALLVNLPVSTGPPEPPGPPDPPTNVTGGGGKYRENPFLNPPKKKAKRDELLLIAQHLI